MCVLTAVLQDIFLSSSENVDLSRSSLVTVISVMCKQYKRWQLSSSCVSDLVWHDLCVDKVAGLRRQLLVGRDAAMEEVQLRNRFLSDKLERLEQAFASRQPPHVSQVINTLIRLIY